MKKKDCLLRENFAVPDICALIDYHSRQWLNKPEEDRSNISFAIDGEWGCGKSFVLEMVEEKLKKEKINNGLEDRYVVFHYNCWEYDYYDEPLVAIVSMMVEQIENEKIFSKEEKKKFVAVLKTAAVVAVSCLNAQLEAKTKINFNDLIQNLKAAEDGNAELIKSVSDFDPLWEFKRALNLLKKQIAEIAKNRTVVFVVDELDRCLPEYAIKVLERLHHISEGLKNLITVIAVDKSRLLDSISNAFGYDKGEDFKDSERYMKKFVNFYYPLDKGLFNYPNDSIKYKNYLDLFDKKKFNDMIYFSDYMFYLFWEIDIREQEHLVEKTEMIHTIVNEDNKSYDHTVMYMELLLTVLYTYYNVKHNDLWGKIFGDYELGDSLKSFRELYFKDVRYEEKVHYNIEKDKDEKIKLINDSIIGRQIHSAVEKRILGWYVAFYNATFPDRLPVVSNGFSRDTSFIKEKYGIDMEENLQFLRKFYDKLIRLS